MHRISNLTIFLLIICAGLIQATALGYVSLLGVKPDLLLTIVVFFSLSCVRNDAIKTAVAAGLIKDITSSSILGGHTISFLLVALLLNYHQRKFYKERSSTQFLVTFFCYFFASLLALLLNIVSYKGLIPDYPFLDIALKGAVYTGFISPLVFFTLSKVLRVCLAPSP